MPGLLSSSCVAGAAEKGRVGPGVVGSLPMDRLVGDFKDLGFSSTWERSLQQKSDAI